MIFRRSLPLSLAILALAVGCSSDPGPSAEEKRTAIDGAGDDPAGGECTLADAPGGLPEVSGTFLQTGGADPQTPPTLAGGEVTGLWAISGVTVYLPGIAALIVDAEASTVDGQGWFNFDGQNYEFVIDVDLSVLPGPDAEPLLATALETGSMGSYTVEGDNVEFVPDCFFGADQVADEGGESINLAEALDHTVGFASDADGGQLMVGLDLGLGENILLLIDIQPAG